MEANLQAGTPAFEHDEKALILEAQEKEKFCGRALRTADGPQEVCGRSADCGPELRTADGPQENCGQNEQRISKASKGEKTCPAKCSRCDFRNKTRHLKGYCKSCQSHGKRLTAKLNCLSCQSKLPSLGKRNLKDPAEEAGETEEPCKKKKCPAELAV
jgi:hypothetical protein